MSCNIEENGREVDSEDVAEEASTKDKINTDSGRILDADSDHVLAPAAFFDSPYK